MDKFEFSMQSPESLGIPSEAIQRFQQELEVRRLCLHGVMIIRHGKLAAVDPVEAPRRES